MNDIFYRDNTYGDFPMKPNWIEFCEELEGSFS